MRVCEIFKLVDGLGFVGTNACSQHANKIYTV